MATNNHTYAEMPADDLVAVIGNAPPSSSWPIYVWAVLWVMWLLFLLFMIIQR